VVGEGGEADGFKVFGVGHWAPPVFGRWWVMAGVAKREVLNGSIACICNTPKSK
jgi:hypothetical protein